MWGGCGGHGQAPEAQGGSAARDAVAGVVENLEEFGEPGQGSGVVLGMAHQTDADHAVVYAASHDGANHSEDVLARRARSSLRDL